jgi:hypothetical protein
LKEHQSWNSPDCQRFLVLQPQYDDSQVRELHVVTNWYEELKRRVPLPDAPKPLGETKLSLEHLRTVEWPRQLVTLYESWNKPDKAQKWRAKLPGRDNVNE